MKTMNLSQMTQALEWSTGQWLEIAMCFTRPRRTPTEHQKNYREELSRLRQHRKDPHDK
jgi:hypothetical protein